MTIHVEKRSYLAFNQNEMKNLCRKRDLLRMYNTKIFIPKSENKPRSPSYEYPRHKCTMCKQMHMR